MKQLDLEKMQQKSKVRNKKKKISVAISKHKKIKKKVFVEKKISDNEKVVGKAPTAIYFKREVKQKTEEEKKIDFEKIRLAATAVKEKASQEPQKRERPPAEYSNTSPFGIAKDIFE